MHITGQPCCARFIVGETEAHVGGDFGPRLEFSATSRCREVVSQQRLGGVPFAGPRHPVAARHLHPGTSRPSRALGRLRGGGEDSVPLGPALSTSTPRAPRLWPRALSPARTLPRVSPARARPRPDPPSPPTPLPCSTRGPCRSPHALVRSTGVPCDRASLTGSRRSGSPGPAHRQRLPRPPQPLHREPGAARPLARSLPRSRAQPARAPGRSRAEPPRGRTEKRGWSRPSPR